MSRKISARNPSHFGSKIHVPPPGNASTRLESIGKIGGLTGRCTPLMLYRAAIVMSENWLDNPAQLAFAEAYRAARVSKRRPRVCRAEILGRREVYRLLDSSGTRATRDFVAHRCIESGAQCR